MAVFPIRAPPRTKKSYRRPPSRTRAPASPTLGMNADAAARTCWGVRALLILVLRLPLSCTEPVVLEMAVKTQTVMLNGNATIPCKILGSLPLNIETMGLNWLRKTPLDKTDVKVFEFYDGNTHTNRSGAYVSLERLAMGDASLELPGVSLWEAGEYRCKVVKTPDSGQRTVRLVVVACPVSRVSEEPAKMKDNDTQYILCQSSGFYPEDINITWHKRTQENSQYVQISEGITTGPAIKNEDGTFNVTSRLRLEGSLEHNVTYQCEVRHSPSCPTQRLNITLPRKGSETKSESQNTVWWIVLSFIGVAVLIIIICICKRHC